jgi:Protein of unknown function (DUF2924)
MLAPTASPAAPDCEAEIARLRDLGLDELRARWRTIFRRRAPAHLPRQLLFRVVAYRLQAERYGDLDGVTRKLLDRVGSKSVARDDRAGVVLNVPRPALRPGTVLVREWDGRPQQVMVLTDGFAWNGKSYRSLSQVALAMTGTRWSGPRFFGVKGSAEVRP